MHSFRNKEVSAVFDGYPEKMRKRLLRLRQLIFDTAGRTEGVGDLEETLKFGQPAYLPKKARVGTTVRIDALREDPRRYAIYFHCQTNLISTFRSVFSDKFSYDGNRAILLNVDREIPEKELRVCIEAALTYHLSRRKQRRL